MHIHRIDRNKSPLKISGNVAVGVLRDCQKIFRAAIYRAHRAVIFAVAQPSCLHSHYICDDDDNDNSLVRRFKSYIWLRC